MTASPNDKDGGALPAFPSPPIPGATDHRSEQRDGLSLRDYFAAKALQGMLANSTITDHGGFTREGCAAEAYHHADAMLSARLPGQPGPSGPTQEGKE